MRLEDQADPCKVACVLRHYNGTYSVLRCTSRERPIGHRKIVRRFHGFATRGAALEHADKINEGMVPL